MNGISWVLFFNTISSKAMEINIIIFNSISFVLIFICFIAIKWKEIPYPHLIAFLLMFIIIIIDLIFSSFIRYWRAKNLIKTEKKYRKYFLYYFLYNIIHFIIRYFS